MEKSIVTVELERSSARNITVLHCYSLACRAEIKLQHGPNRSLDGYSTEWHARIQQVMLVTLSIQPLLYNKSVGYTMIKKQSRVTRTE